MNLTLKFRQRLQAVSTTIVDELDALILQLRAPQRYVSLKNAANVTYYLWVDATGDVRVGTTVPTDATEGTTGTVVGGQS